MKENEYKDLENQGWDAMFQTLDHEMPVKKKRRGALWFFLFVGFAAIGLGYWFQKNQKSVPVNPITISKPIAQNNVSKNSSSLPKTDVNTEGINEPKFEKSQRFLKLYNTTKTTNNLISENAQNLTAFDNATKTTNDTKFGKLSKFPELDSKTQTINKPTAEIAQNLTASDNVTKTTNKPTAEITQNLTAFDNATKTTNEPKFGKLSKFPELDSTTKTTNKPISENAQNLTELDNIARLKIAPLSIIQDTNLKIEPKPIVSTSPSRENNQNKLRWGLTAGIHTENGQKLDGYQAGVVLLKPLNNRWSLTTGLSFRQAKTTGDSTTYYKTESLFSSPSASQALQNSTPITLDKLYYLEMPLMIQFKMNKRFAFATGAKGAFLLGQSIKTGNSSVFWVKSNTNFSNGQVLLDMVSTKTLGLNRWDASWISSITYSPNKHIGLSLRYDLGLSNIINLNRWTAYNRYLGLNLTYQF